MKTNTKRCSKCEDEKGLNEFSKREDCHLGVESHCKKCRNKWKREYRQGKEFKSRWDKTIRDWRNSEEGKISMNTTTKQCTECNLTYPKENFGDDMYSKDGLSSKCKNCKKLYRRNYRKSDSGKMICRYSRARTRYGLSKEAYDSIIGCKSVCDICGSIFKNREPQIDHSHVNGIVRGALCQRCNLMLGASRDSIQILRNGIEYLKMSGGEQP